MGASLSDLEPHIDTDSSVAIFTPFDLETVTKTHREHAELKTIAAHYKSMHTAASARVERVCVRYLQEVQVWRAKYKAAQAEFEQTKARLHGLRRQAFGNLWIARDKLMRMIG